MEEVEVQETRQGEYDGLVQLMLGIKNDDLVVWCTVHGGPKSNCGCG